MLSIEQGNNIKDLQNCNINKCNANALFNFEVQEEELSILGSPTKSEVWGICKTVEQVEHAERQKSLKNYYKKVMNVWLSQESIPGRKALTPVCV